MTAFVSNPALPFRKVRSTTGCVDRVERRLGTVTAPTACARTPNVSRRSVLSLSAALAAGLLLRAEDQTKGGTATASAAATNVTAKGGSDLLGTTETNQAYGFSFNAPASGWTKNITSLSSGRSATIFLRDADGDSNISMVTTPVPGDFAKISSFGTIDGVMSTIIPPKKNDIEGELVSSKIDSMRNAYVYEYTITQKGVKRHLYTIFSLNAGKYLNTLTGQSKEEVWSEVEPMIKAVADSFQVLEEE